MKYKNKEFLMKHLSILLNDIDSMIEDRRQKLIQSQSTNYFSPSERVNLNADLVSLIDEKLLVKSCIEEISNMKETGLVLKTGNQC